MSEERIKVGAKKARDFREKYGPVALVTGAAQGIGRAFANSVAARGLSVLMIDVQEEALDAGETFGDALGVSSHEAHLSLSTIDVGEFDRHGVSLEGHGAKRATEMDEFVFAVAGRRVASGGRSLASLGVLRHRSRQRLVQFLSQRKVLSSESIYLDVVRLEHAQPSLRNVSSQLFTPLSPLLRLRSRVLERHPRLFIAIRHLYL